MVLFFSNLSSSDYLLNTLVALSKYQKIVRNTSRRLNQMVDYWFRLSIPIISFESLDINLLAIFNILGKNIDFGGVDDELVSEIVANKAFFKENISFFLTSNSNSDFDNSDFNQNNSNSDKNNSIKSVHD